MRVNLREERRDAGVAIFSASLPPSESALRLTYATRTGALMRVDGLALGAFDREHHDVVVPPSPAERSLELEVELEALPTNGLPAGPGLVWWFINAIARQRPPRSIAIEPTPAFFEGERRGDLDLIGHSHLDVAWLWTYAQTTRKAQRTFAIACDLLDRDSGFVFVQSQPQLYAFVEDADPPLFARVREHVARGRLDATVAALWVETDCNLPSGESLLRQMLFAHRYCVDRLEAAPQVAWLPDSFGFANTLPQLLAHAGIAYFATTKLQWNDTTRFPYPQFVWRGPDGSGVIGALLASYEGEAYPWRIATARKRDEPLVLGYGDGGGGVTPGMLDRSRSLGPWIEPRDWFERLERREDLPVHADELYLEYHRGVYTTHHGVKAQNALLERALIEAEELLAWCVAVHAPRNSISQFRERLQAAWEIVLRNQFHDVLPGTSIAPVYDDVAQEYARAGELVVSVIAAAQTILPRPRGAQGRAPRCAPEPADGSYLLDNGLLRIRVRADGVITELRAGDSRNACVEANALALYNDRPKAWEAWNIDDGYQATQRRVVPEGARIESDALAFDVRLGSSPGNMRVWLDEGEAFVRVELDVDWRERRTLLRVENRFALHAERVTYGTPHGTIERSALANTPASRAQYEVPGQRFAAVRAEEGGAAVFALDTYGWSGRDTPEGLRIGHSLLRGTCWPDPHADEGRHRLSYAFAPLHRATTIGELEHAWLRFAHDVRVRLFTCDDTAVLVAACKPAEDANGVVVRVRNCEAQERSVRLRCGARMTSAASVDALERPIEAAVAIEGEDLAFTLPPFALRSFRVRFSHGP